MKRNIVILVIVVFVLITGVFYSAATTLIDKNNKAKESKEELYQSFLLSMLSPYIQEAILDYNKSASFDLWNIDVLSISRLTEGAYYFEITMVVETFENAHNPPYESIKLTITKDVFGIRVTSFHILEE